ncbi:MAG TPA: SRPBCC family protein [Bryobacteraceae bacterium]|nr:SRPBCC family protein [Bryobacteraceae bacterium]
MTRNEFIAGMAGIAGVVAMAKTEGPAPWFHGKRAKFEYTGDLTAPPETVFPLLCPVREYEWLDGWTCEMIYSESGIAEHNCVFRTSRPPAGPAVWCVNRYEPPARIEFVVTSADEVARLCISLERAANNGTRIRWERMFTGLNEEGNARTAAWNVEIDRALCEKIEHFTRTGKMLRA